jgi:hypothetical protein
MMENGAREVCTIWSSDEKKKRQEIEALHLFYDDILFGFCRTLQCDILSIKGRILSSG